MRVLIVDDEPSIRKTTRIALETAGHSAAEAATAARALKAVADEAFDVVFLDLDLGTDNGLETLGRLLQARPAPAVVIFTAYATIATAVEAMRLGAFDFVPKPFTPDQIRAVLARVEKTAALQQRVRALETDLAAETPPLITRVSTRNNSRHYQPSICSAASPPSMARAPRALVSCACRRAPWPRAAYSFASSTRRSCCGKRAGRVTAIRPSASRP